MGRTSSSVPVLFRVDANSRIGLGHMARCATLAREMRGRGLPVAFVVSDAESARHVPKGLGRVFVAESAWDDFENEDLSEIRLALGISEFERPLFVLDSYPATRRYVERVDAWASVCYLGMRHDFLGPLAAIADYGVLADEEFYRSMYGAGEARLLLGPKYAPLARAYQGRSRRSFEGVPRRILVTTGGGDPLSLMPDLLSCLLESKELAKVVFDVVIGPLFENVEALRGAFGESPRVRFHAGLASLADLIFASDAAISAAGSTVYELCAAGVPSAVFAVSDEQRETAERLGSLGVVRLCGGAHGESLASNISAQIVDIVSSAYERKVLSARAGALVDGHGAWRIAEAFVEAAERADR